MTGDYVPNQEIPVLAKRVYELSVLKPAELEERRWEALAILNAVYSSATPEGVAAAQNDKVKRWGKEIEAAGLLSRFDPKWHLKTDDGKPPVAQIALASALGNKSRDIRTRLQALQFIPEKDRPALVDMVKALEDEAWRGAKGEARDQFLDTMKKISKTWFENPWLTVLPYDGNPPPVSIMIENQGETHDGGWYDDPSDDTEWEKLKFGWREAIRTWNPTFLRDNPVSQFYLGVTNAAQQSFEAAANVAEGGKKAAEATGKILGWIPYVVTAIGAVGLASWALSFASSREQSARDSK